jgi:hypothetical protein
MSEKEPQDKVFDDCGISEFIDSALEGYSATVFAYGLDQARPIPWPAMKKSSLTIYISGTLVRALYLEQFTAFGTKSRRARATIISKPHILKFIMSRSVIYLTYRRGYCIVGGILPAVSLWRI